MLVRCRMQGTGCSHEKSHARKDGYVQIFREILIMKSFADCQKFLANPDQLCYARLSRLEEGSGRGQRIVDVCNGSGLQFTVTPDRGMNLVECSFMGIPIAFRTPCGHRDTSGDWLHNWTGGMMTTAGLRNIGSPSGTQSLHGAISAEAAEHLAPICRNGEICISGTLREGALFDADLSLERRISTGYGRNRIDIHDRVSNGGEFPTFTEILYHCNFGFPFVSPSIRFEAPEHEIEPRNPESASGQAEWNRFPEPLSGFNEHCFRHKLPAGKDGVASMRVVNPDLGIAVRIEYRTDTLPYLVEWKKPSKFGYVLGLEPTNGSLNGCEFDRQNGFGVTLESGSSVEYECSLIFETV